MVRKDRKLSTDGKRKDSTTTTTTTCVFKNVICDEKKCNDHGSMHGLRPREYGQHFLATCRVTNVTLQVAIVCCPYYHLRAQQIFM